MWFRRKPAVNGTAKEVEQVKSQAHESANQTERDIQRLNKLLRADGITLKINIATRGRHA